ncbi:MAG: DUF4881 domain-containing protein [Desulfovibrio sp.]|jgi:hypothetical protein|nr:DUF4881 domain-containing protein [Desulfovibrio sp.]
MKKHILTIALLAALSFVLTACDYDGGVEQGRVVAYEPGKNVTLVLDTSPVRNKPLYNGKTAVYKLPVDSMDMGADPTCGGLLAVNPEKKTVSVYDPAGKSVRELPVDFTDVQKDIDARHPLVAGKSFPMIDRENLTVTVYAPTLRSLVTFSPGAAISMPPDTWKFGDEARVAFSNAEKGQALRFMNITKTNIFSR